MEYLYGTWERTVLLHRSLGHMNSGPLHNILQVQRINGRKSSRDFLPCHNGLTRVLQLPTAPETAIHVAPLYTCASKCHSCRLNHSNGGCAEAWMACHRSPAFLWSEAACD